MYARYRIAQHLGASVSSRVYCAEDVLDPTSSPLAIKVFPRAVADNVVDCALVKRNVIVNLVALQNRGYAYMLVP